MTKTNKKIFIAFSILFYVVGIAMMIVGTKYDLDIDIKLFNPQNSLSVNMEAFGQFVSWAMWGPMFTVLFLTAHTFNECLEMIGRVFPFIKPIKNTDAKAFKILDKLVKIVWQVAFFVLADIGWKKLIENILNKFANIPQGVYFAVCAVVSALAIFLFSKMDKKLLNKLESLALAGLVLGILCKVVENCKSITSRIRFREMVAWSNGITHEDGGEIVSCGELTKMKSSLDKSMVQNTDFSAFTKWFVKGVDTGYYDHPNSFPSGHTTHSCATFLSVLLCSAFDKIKKFMPCAMIVSIVYVATMAFSRMVAGAHYLTDVAGGALIGYTLFLLVFGVYTLFVKKEILPTRDL